MSCAFPVDLASAAAPGEPGVQHQLRQLRGFPRPGLSNEDDGVVGAELGSFCLLVEEEGEEEGKER